MAEELAQLHQLKLNSHAINLIKLNGHIINKNMDNHMQLILSKIKSLIDEKEYKCNLINSGLCIYFQNYTFVLKSNGVFEIYFNRQIYELESDFVLKVQRIIRFLIIKLINPSMISNLQSTSDNYEHMYCVSVKLSCMNAQLISDDLDKELIYKALLEQSTDLFIKTKDLDINAWIISAYKDIDFSLSKPIMFQSSTDKYAYICNPHQHNTICWGVGCYDILVKIDLMIVNQFQKHWFSHFSILNLQNAFTNHDLYMFMLENNIEPANAYTFFMSEDDMECGKNTKSYCCQNNEGEHNKTEIVTDVVVDNTDIDFFDLNLCSSFNEGENKINDNNLIHSTTHVNDGVIINPLIEILNEYNQHEFTNSAVDFMPTNTPTHILIDNSEHQTSDANTSITSESSKQIGFEKIQSNPSILKLKNDKCLFKSKCKNKTHLPYNSIKSNIISETTKLYQLTPSNAKHIQETIQIMSVDTETMQKVIMHAYNNLIQVISKMNDKINKTFKDIDTMLNTLITTINKVSVNTNDVFESPAHNFNQSELLPKLNETIITNLKKPCGRNAGKSINELRQALLTDINKLIQNNVMNTDGNQ